ncbi:MAG: prepilin-type N-terminal cleavage/methylation domain-containing protein [Planctomycetia bacterium]
MTEKLRKSKAGFTLVELLVVLLILVAIAGTALQGSWQLAEDSRLRETEASLAGLERAIVGEERSPAQSFVSDIGRLPTLVQGEMPELFTASAGIALFSVQTPAGDARVRLGCGWRGPYWRGAFGSTELRDGWGAAWRCLDADGNAILDGEPWRALASYGRDGNVGGVGYDSDQAWVLESASLPSRLHGSLIVRVQPLPVSGSAQSLVVRVYGPVNGLVQTLRQEQFSTSDPTLVRVFEAVPIGARAVCVYQSDSTASVDPQQPVPALVRQAAPRAVELPAGGLPELFFDLSTP